MLLNVFINNNNNSNGNKIGALSGLAGHLLAHATHAHCELAHLQIAPPPPTHHDGEGNP